jgi:hypothetical protein
VKVLDVVRASRLDGASMIMNAESKQKPYTTFEQDGCRMNDSWADVF